MADNLNQDAFWTEIELEKALESGTAPKFARFMLAAISGVVPGFGGAIGATATAWSENGQDKVNDIIKNWLKFQENEIKEIGLTLAEVFLRLEQVDETIKEKVRERLQSPEYLRLIKKCFRDWSAAESEEKRKLIRNLLINAAFPDQLCGDDILRMFIEWIDRYQEAHFKVVRAIYNKNGITRGAIWSIMDGSSVTENSPQADLFKVLIRDLSLGSIIRQHVEYDYMGNPIKKVRSKPIPGGKPVVSAFDNNEPYELTGLGQWFVHYTMNELVQTIGGGQ